MSTAEIWKEIQGTLGIYEASTLGRVRSIDRVGQKMNRWGFVAPWRIKGRILVPQIGSNGYLQVSICGDGRRDQTGVHRLVAVAFLAPPEQDGLDVNHLDGNKQNNEPSNLEWCTRKENMAHARATGLHDPYKRIKGTPKNGGAPVYFDSLLDAAAAMGVARSCNISSAAAGKLKTAYGHRWELVAP